MVTYIVHVDGSSPYEEPQLKVLTGDRKVSPDLLQSLVGNRIKPQLILILSETKS